MRQILSGRSYINVSTLFHTLYFYKKVSKKKRKRKNKNHILTMKIVGISSISSAEATGLPSKTSAIPNKTNEFVIELDVFHQLHCLNTLRKSLYLERYVNEIGDLYDNKGERNYTSTTMRHWGKSNMPKEVPATIVTLG